jgi:uncharacterized protein YndB with AHSA1/START domain
MAPSHELKVTKHIKAPRTKVFAAWTTPEIMKQWFFPTGMSLSNAESDIRVGGKYRATMKGEQGTSTAFGVYREIVAGERLVFTHAWEEGDRLESLVTVEFADKDGGTQVTLTQTGLASKESVDGHTQGWAGTFDNLARYFS